MADKRNIFLVGPMGSGKSTIGKHLAQQLHMEFFDSDAVIEERAGADISWVFDVEGEESFRKREEKVIDSLTQQQGIVLATGGGSIESKDNRNYLSSRGIVVYFEATIEKQIARTYRDKKRPLLRNGDPQVILENLAKQRNLLYREIADFTVQTDEQVARAVAQSISKLIHTE